MTNGHFDFELEGVKYSLHFGMTAVRIFSIKSGEELVRLQEANPDVKPEDLKADGVKSFAYLVYAGLCNSADIKEQRHPSFQEAYELAESILMDDSSLQDEIFEAFNSSRATKKQMELLGPKDEKKKKK